MNEADTRFRSAAFGGFHRQDVLTYLTHNEKEHDKTVSELREQLEKWKREAEEARVHVQSLEQKLEEETRRSAALSGELEQVRSDREEKLEILRQREAELARFRTDLSDIEPKALAYERIKERAASIELDAHERAQLTTDEAKKEASHMRQETAAWLREVQEKYEQLRRGLGEAMMRSTAEIEQICRMFDRMSKEFDSYEVLVRELLGKAERVETEPLETEQPEPAQPETEDVAAEQPGSAEEEPVAVS